MVKKEDGDLLVDLPANVDGTMDAIGRLLPMCLAWGDCNVLGLVPILVFDMQRVATQDHGDPVEGVAMPRCSLAGREAQPSNQVVSAMVKHLLGHGRSLVDSPTGVAYLRGPE